MEKILIIAEKGKQALAYSNALLWNSSRNGTAEGKNIKIIPLSGHIVTFQEPRDILGDQLWNYDKLPLNIGNIPYKISDDKVGNRLKSDIFSEVKKEMLDPSYSYIINATDNDREWSYIFWELYYKVGAKLPVKRFYPKELTINVLKRDLLSKFQDIEYDKTLFLAGYTRAFVDYHFWNNNTILFSLKAGDLTRVGRVKLAILTIVKKREDAIAAFGKAKDYYLIKWRFSKNTGFYFGTLMTDHRIYSLDEAKQILSDLQKTSQGEIVEMKGETASENPNKLHKLISLWKECSVRFWWNMNKTGEIGQALYDNGLMSYPRTKIEYLSDADRPYIKNYYEGFNEMLGLRYEYHEPGKRVFDGSKVKEHDAIRPIFKKNFQEVLAQMDHSADATKLYHLLITRLFVVFGAPEISQKYSIKTSVGQHM